MWLILALLFVMVVVSEGAPLCIKGNKFGMKGNTMKRLVTSAFLGSMLPLQLHSPPAYAANDALTAANRAMKMTSEHETDERKFQSLPEGSKKRRAIAACKDKDLRAAAGYLSASKCTSDAVDGEYTDIAKAINGEVTVRGKKGARR